MGQQQLLLIVLAMIIVGISLSIAISLFSANAEESTKDTVNTELTNLATISLQYYTTPVTMAGGGRSFTGWQIPSQLKTSMSGTYSIISADDTQLILIGTPLQTSGYTWSITGIVTMDGITTEIIY